MLKHIEEHITLSDSKIYEKVITEINEITSQYKSVVNAKANRVADVELIKTNKMSSLEKNFNRRRGKVIF